MYYPKISLITALSIAFLSVTPTPCNSFAFVLQLTTLSPRAFIKKRPLHITTLEPREASRSSTASSSTEETINGNAIDTTPLTPILPLETPAQPQDEQQYPAQPQCPPPYAAQTLDGRLLCATQCAYEISTPYFRGSSYLPTTTAKRVTRGVNSALIGHTTDGITIAFRGTQSTSVLDWLQNAALFLSNEEDKYIKGKIHNGFYRGTKSLWKPLKGILQEMLEESEARGWSKNVYLTGHSKGGAMASIAAVLLKRDPKLPDPTYVCTFASAKVGDSQFRDAYNQRINQTSYEAHLDLIPFLPPSARTMETMSDEMSEMIEGVLWSETSASQKDKYVWDYQTLGQRKYINEEGEIIDDVTSELDAMRIKEIEEKSILSLDEFKQAHCSGCASEGCGGNYFTAIAPHVCDFAMCVEEGDDDDDDELDMTE